MNKFNKGISTPLVALIIVAIFLIIGGITYYYYTTSKIQPIACTEEAKICPDGSAVGRIGPNCEFAPCPNENTNGTAGKEQACIDSGGIVNTAMCCKSSSDFPSSCLIGACGCSPDNSHQVKACDCGEGKCFDGNICVSL